MILFCEDCGKKNLLNSIEFIAGKPVFRCSFCGYPSPYHFRPQEVRLIEKADLFFKEARSFPETLGIFLYHKELGVLKHDMPEILKKADLDFVGKNLMQSYMINQSWLGDVTEMALFVADKHMVVKLMGDSLFIIIACKSAILPRTISEKLFQLNAHGAS